MKRLVKLISSVALGLAGISATAQNRGSNKTFTFNSIPQDVSELQALPEADMKDPYAVSALTILVLMNYESNLDECIEMLNFLKGPDNISNLEKQQLADRLRGKFYKVRSFFKGATPENNYTPTRPLKIQISSNPYSFQNENWATMYLHSGGADNPRPVKLRKKPSTGQWFLNDMTFLSDIRVPAEEDPWN